MESRIFLPISSRAMALVAPSNDPTLDSLPQTLISCPMLYSTDALSDPALFAAFIVGMVAKESHSSERKMEDGFEDRDRIVRRRNITPTRQAKSIHLFSPPSRQRTLLRDGATRMCIGIICMHPANKSSLSSTRYRSPIPITPSTSCEWRTSSSAFP